MANSLVALMLIATQLLTGGSVSVYLCIRRDGSYRIDTGPNSCAVTKRSCDGSCADRGDEESNHQEACLCTHKGEPSPQRLEHCAVSAEACDCLHIPVLVASDQPTRSAGQSVRGELERLSSLLAVASMHHIARPCLSPPMLLQRDHPGGVAFSLAVIATVVIRC